MTNQSPQNPGQPEQSYQYAEQQPMQQPYQQQAEPPKKKKKGGCLKWGGIGVAALIVIGVASNMGSGSSDSASVATDSSVSAEALPAGDSSADQGGAAQEDSNVSADFKNALRQADTYSNTMHMSKAGLYDQLTSEYGGQFSAEAAQYAVDNVDADWNANALEKAKTYSDEMHMSKAGVYDQLTSSYGEQFTAEEAQYAVDNVDADWNANALEKARTYQDSMAMSGTAVYDQLVSSYGEQFTPEQAQYAVDNL
ncbi:Ltp family lipoprotein [Corynebacterium sp. S7]